MHSRLLALAFAILGYAQPVAPQGENRLHVPLFRAHDAVVALGVGAVAAATTILLGIYGAIAGLAVGLITGAVWPVK